MKVSEIMASNVRTCSPDDSLLVPAKLMWEGDCGCCAVVGSDQRVVGMITDRDICMSGHLSGRPPGAVKVSEVMSKQIHCCRPDDTVYSAESVMRENRVRRLPVIDSDGRLVGILSLNDIAREFARERKLDERDVSAGEVAETLAGVCEPRQHGALASAA